MVQANSRSQVLFLRLVSLGSNLIQHSALFLYFTFGVLSFYANSPYKVNIASTNVGPEA